MRQEPARARHDTGSDAERLYARMGWVRVGTIPDYSIQPRGGLRATTLLGCKRQARGSGCSRLSPLVLFAADLTTQQGDTLPTVSAAGLFGKLVGADNDRDFIERADDKRGDSMISREWQAERLRLTPESKHV